MTYLHHQQPPAQPAVLLVEDHDGARDALSALLKMHGFNVSTASSVDEALHKLNEQAFMILDLHLPDGLGLTILRALKEKKSHTKVAVCSGSTDGKLIRAVRHEGVDQIFNKPVHFAELLHWMTCEPQA
jgi:DNA-binding response OmpR family regulator